MVEQGKNLKIWVDADACPKVIKEILFRAAIRTQSMLILVANHFSLSMPSSPFIKKIQVASGFDVADHEIITQVQSGDLVITADIPLADAVVNKGGIALNPRGWLYTKNNIKERLAMRNLQTELRDNGQLSGGPSKLGKKEVQAFANSLDKFLSSR
jgi:uncharacterized protein YaiI (UPF0178 family)